MKIIVERKSDAVNDALESDETPAKYLDKALCAGFRRAINVILK